MTRYRIETCYEAEDDTKEFDRIGGLPVGLNTSEWPSCHKHPMQLLATIDLSERPTDIPALAGARVVMVFVDSFYETDLGDASAVAVRFASQESIDRIGETDPPDGFVPEAYSHDSSDSSGAFLSVSLCEADEKLDDEESTLGGDAVWPDETGEPAVVPGGRFILRLADFLARGSSNIYVFEGGGVAVGRYEEEDEERVPNWREAVSLARELVSTDGPAAGSLAKFGGAPASFREYGWPEDSRGRPLTHLMTLPNEWLERGEAHDDEDIVATSYFIDLRVAGLDSWDSELDFLVAETILREDIDETGELPEGVELLAERGLELRELEAGLGWRDMLGRNVVGHRGVFHNPAAGLAGPGNDFVFQVEASFLPGVSRPGTIYGGAGWFLYQQPGEVGSGDSDDCDPFDDYGDYDEYGGDDDDDGDSIEESASTGLRALTTGGSGQSYVGGLPPDIGLENWPRYQGELMTHVMTLHTSEVPDLGGHSPGLSIFLSTAMHHKAFGPYSDHAAVVTVTAEQLATRSPTPEGEVLEVLEEKALGLEDVSGALPNASYAGGRPRWIQQPQGAGSFVAQIDEDLVDINLGDSGTLYVFDDTAFFQCC